MARRRSRLVDYAVYLVARVGICVVQAMSWSTSLSLARWVAWTAFHVDGRHRRVADENLRHAFPHLDSAERRRLVYATFDHLFTALIEIFRMPRVLHRGNVEQMVQYANPGDYDRAMSWVNSGRPLLILTGHFGNWEIIGYVMGLCGFRGGVVARRLDNPYLERYLERIRRKTGQTLLDKNHDYERILKVLSQGGSLGMAGDQDAGQRGMFVNFFGRPASTFKSIALLSLEYSAPIMVYGSVRVGHPMKYRLYLESVILPEEHAHDPDAVRTITQRYTDALERMIRRHPEQYFWLHRRWKHQPLPKKRALAA